ncbi:hypothetical protein TrRE_jg11180, partial [Triparma retinervis]
MVKRVNLEDVATSSYLLPIFASLSKGGEPSEAHNPFGGIEEKIEMDVFERNWRAICEREHPYLSDAQLTMVMSSFLPSPPSTSRSSSPCQQISFGEFVHAYKVVISTMQSLQLCPRTLHRTSSTSSFRDRIRSRVAVFLQTLSEGSSINSAQEYLRDLLMKKELSAPPSSPSPPLGQSSKGSENCGSGEVTDTETVGTYDEDETIGPDDELLAVMMSEKDKQIFILTQERDELEAAVGRMKLPQEGGPTRVERGGFGSWLALVLLLAVLLTASMGPYGGWSVKEDA